jgi:glycosyltransferase involved in cell wall biosynthesis
MSAKHIGPDDSGHNGVAKYSKIIDTIVEKMPQNLADIRHIELGYTGFRELWIAFKYVRKSDSKIVLTLHDPPIVTGKPFGIFLPGEFVLIKVLRKGLDIVFGKIMVHKVVRGAAAIIILNPLAKPLVVKQFGVDAHKLHILPLPSLTPASTDSRAKKFKVLTFGNLSPRKGTDLLIEAFAGAFASVPDAELVVVGGHTGEEKYMAKLKVMSGGLNVNFRGILSDIELSREISQSSLVAFPYYNPGIIHASGPLIASMAAGKPVIASRIPIFEGEIEDGITGLLFNEGDSTDLSNKLKQLRSHPDFAKRLGKNAARHIYSWHNLDIIKELLLKVYEAI